MTLSPYSGYGNMFFGNRNVDTLKYYVSWSYACISRLAWGGASRQLVGYEEATTKGQLDSKELLYDHWLSKLLRYPNPELSTTAVWLLGYKWLLLNGNCYYWVEKDKEGIPIALWPLAANRIRILLGGKGQRPVVGYRYSMGGEQHDIPAEDILHIAEPEPSEVSPFVGASRMLAAMDAVQVDAETMAYLARYFHNDALPAFVVQHPERMDDDQFETWKSRFNETFQGSGNAGKWAFLEDNMQITPIVSNGRQTELQKMDLINRDRICIVFGVPEPYLTGKHQNKATSETVRAEFYSLGVHPLVELFTQALTRFVRRVDESLVIDFDRYQYQDPVDERAEVEMNVRLGIKTAEEYRLEDGLEPLPAAATSNELRTTVGGMTAMQGLLIAYGTGQISRDSAIATSVIFYGLSTEEAARMFPERGAIAAPEPDESDDAPAPPVAPQKAFRATVAEEDPWTEKALYAYWKRYDSIAQGGAAELEIKIAKAYRKLEKEVLANLEEKSASGYLAKVGVDTAGSLFNVEEFKWLLAEETGQSLLEFLKRVGDEVFEEAGEGDVQKPFSERLDESLKESTAKITTAADTAKTELQELLEKNRRLPVSEVRDLIRKKFEFYTEAGANRIAKTTATFATGMAQREAAKTLVDEVENIESVKRSWLPQVGGNRRPLHQAARGQLENDDGLFEVGGELIRCPGDGSAANSIHCDCVTRIHIKRKKE